MSDSDSDSNTKTAIGLDVGTSRVVLAKRHGGGYEFLSQLNAFVNVPHSRMTQTVLEKERVPHMVKDGEIHVFGRESETFANLFHTETRRPMREGLLNPTEPLGLQLIRHLIESLAGTSKKKGQRVCFSIPAPRLEGQEVPTFHQAALRQILIELGYEPEGIEEGLAVIYSELEDTNYTGIGISAGGGMCNVCMAYLSVPVFSYSITKGGDFIDSNAAAATGEMATRVRIIKEESFAFTNSQGDKILQAVKVYYDELIDALVSSLEEAFTRSKRMPRIKKAIPLVLSGGSAMPEGFRDRFSQALQARKLPIQISEIRLAKELLNATAKGALLAALSKL